MHEHRSRTHLAVILADIDFEDKIVLVSDNIQYAIASLHRVEEAVR